VFGCCVLASWRRQLVQVADEDDVQAPKGVVGHVPGQAQILVHAIQQSGGYETHLVYHQDVDVLPKALQSSQLLTPGERHVAHFAIALVLDRQQQTGMQGGPIDVEGGYACRCCQDHAPPALSQHVGSRSRHHRLAAAARLMYQEAESLQVAPVHGLGTFQDGSQDVLHAPPLFQDLWARVLDGQHVERLLKYRAAVTR